MNTKELFYKYSENWGNGTPLMDEENFTKAIAEIISSPVDQLVIRQKFTLEQIKADETLMDGLDKVLIWTDEHGAYWRENGGGYTWDKFEAGIYEIKDAYRRTKHCSEDKLIKFLSV